MQFTISPTTWARRGHAHLKIFLQDADPRVLLAFWLLGLINNVLYVIILSAALDLVGPSVPKSIVLLADVVPGACVKLFAPYFIHSISYSTRILIFVALSTTGMLLVALTPSTETHETSVIAVKLAGVVLASLSSGGGEASFLSLTHYYGQVSLAAWSSGTGAAGLVGAGAYLAATTWMGWTVTGTLLACAGLPMIMLAAFYIVLPRDPLRAGGENRQSYQPLGTAIPAEEDEDDDGAPFQEDSQAQALLASPSSSTILSQTRSSSNQPPPPSTWYQTLRSNLLRTRRLIIPYMLPLFVVYASEYLINQAISPTLLFPLASTPFNHFRDFYPTYSSIYQSGVLISRSSSPLIRLPQRALLPLSLLQTLNLLILTLHALFPFIPSVYLVFLIIFYEGLIGGAVYVNTFAAILENEPEEVVDGPGKASAGRRGARGRRRGEVGEREYALGAASVADSMGICFAGFLGVGLERSVCAFQVRRGRDWCTKL